MKKLSARQIDALSTLANYVEREVQLCTSQYTHSSSGVPLYPDAFRPVDVVKMTTIRSLEKRGFLTIVNQYWRGADVVPHSSIWEALDRLDVGCR